MAKSHRRAKILSRSINKQRKEKTKGRIDLKYSFNVQSVSDNWDSHKTLKQNYEALGLAIDINNIDPRMQAPEEVTDVPAVKASGLMADAITTIETAPAPPPIQVKSMQIKEQRQLMKMIAKYKEDFEAMERDISLNINQQTATQIKHRIELLHRLQAL